MPLLAIAFAIGRAEARAQTSTPACPRVAINLDVTKRWSPNPTIDFHLSIAPQQTTPVALRFTRDPAYDLESKDQTDQWSSEEGKPLIVAAGGQRRLALKLHGENPGLLHLVATPESGWPNTGTTSASCTPPNLDVVIDSGFSKDAALGVVGPQFACQCGTEPAVAGLPIAVNDLANVSMHFRRHDGTPFPVSEQVTVVFSSADAQLSHDGNTWADKPVEMPVRRGDRPVLFLKPVRWTQRGVINAKVQLAKGVDLFQCEIVYNAKIPWWALLTGTLIGALLWVTADEVINAKADLAKFWSSLKKRRAAPYVVGVVTGVIAFFCRDLDIWGFAVHVDTLQGAAILGFAAATIGLTAIFEKIRTVFGANTTPQLKAATATGSSPPGDAAKPKKP